MTAGTEERRLAPSRGSRLRSGVRDPAVLFVVVATLAGIAITLLAPAFSGIDEPAHFVRSARIAEGHLIPDQAPAGATGDGVCLPRPLLRGVSAARVTYMYGSAPTDAASDAQFVGCGAADDDRGFVAIPTFAWYSPVGYAPQAVAVFIGRVVGLGAGAQLLLARLATLLAYVAIITVAIRRAPAGRWALAAVALLPVALFEAATSVSPDALTTALVIFVVSSAWRAYDRPEVVGTRAFLAESILASLLLGMAKPTYVLVSLAYLIPLLAQRRRASWTLGLPALLGIGLSSLWYRSQQDRFACDVSFFGIVPDPVLQMDQLVHGPHTLIGAGLRAVPDFGGGWLQDTFAVGDRVSGGLSGALAIVVCVAVFLVAGAQRAEGEHLVPGAPARLSMVGLGVAGYFAVLAGWLVYCAAPVVSVINPPHARLLVSVLPAFAVGLAPAGRVAQRLARSPVPLGLLLAAVDLAFVVDLGLTMR